MQTIAPMQALARDRAGVLYGFHPSTHASADNVHCLRFLPAGTMQVSANTEHCVLPLSILPGRDLKGRYVCAVHAGMRVSQLEAETGDCEMDQFTLEMLRKALSEEEAHAQVPTAGIMRTL